ncbi:MAG: universal stress protein [Cyanobacteria bacterium]|nr:universal stress protein [Cyanobacteriota bacterium]
MRILVAVDGSIFSEAAMASVINHQWPENPTVKLVTVVKVKEPFLHLKLPSNNCSKQEVLSHTESAMAELALNVANRMPHASVNFEVLTGSVRSTIARAAKLWKADLVVLGSHGKKGLDAILGSVSQSVLEQANCPVLIIKCGATSAHLEESRDFERILVAVDGSDCSRGAVSWMARHSWLPSASFKVLSAVADKSETVSNETDPQKATWIMKEWGVERQKVLDAVKTQALKLNRGIDNEHVTLDVVPGDPCERITGIARGWKAELIVMGSHGKSAVNRLIVGSVSQAVAAAAPCSVLIVKGVDADGNIIGDQRKLKKEKPQAPKFEGPKPPPIKRELDRPPFTMM